MLVCNPVQQSSEQAHFTSEVMGSILARAHVKRVSQRSVESRGFSASFF